MTYLRMGPTIYEVLEEHELYRKVTAKNRLSQYRIYKENGREQIPSDDITKLFDVYVAHRNGRYGIVGETEAKEIVNTGSGEMFLVDLLEKLEGKFEVIQSNTDGIMVKPISGSKEEDLVAIADEWQKRTGFVLKFERIFDIVQRDVNNYMYRDENGSIHTKGEAVKYYKAYDNPFSLNAYNSKEALIIHQCIVEYYMNHKTPEETVESYKDKPTLFQYICRPISFDYLTLETGRGSTRLQKVNRCFAGKNPGVIYKHTATKHARYSNLPDRVFVHNDEILSKEAVEDLKSKIDYSYYVKRAYERIKEFSPINTQMSLF